MKLPVAKSISPKHVARIGMVLTALLMLTGRTSAAVLCETILQNVYKQLDDLCSDLVRNQACYGNDSIRTELNVPYRQEVFTKAGDRIPLTAVRELYTLPMDTATGTWGVSLLKAQANLPDTLPGQNITFILYGDTHLTNADEDGRMSAFYFTTGLGQPACKAAPADGITIRSPKGMRAKFTANGVTFDIGSTVTLRAHPNKEMQVQLVEGSAIITTHNKTENLIPGQSLSVPLGGTNGLEAVGIPSSPVNAPEDQAQQNFINAVANSTSPTNTPQPVQPTSTPKETKTPKPTKTAKPPKPTNPPKPTKPPKPTNPPKPTDQPKPTKPPKGK